MTTLISDALIAVIIAPFIGSFVSVLVVRLPKGEDVIVTRSHCRNCGHILGPWELIPIVSWIVQAGKCRACGSAVSPVYPGMEIAAIVVALWAVATVDADVRWITVALGWVLLALAVMDARDFFLADELTIPLVPLGLAVCWLLSPEQLYFHIAGAVLGLASMIALAWGYKTVRGGDGLGLGDAKLFAAAGAWTGLEGLGTVLLYAVLVNLLMLAVARPTAGDMGATTPIPLGTGLAAGIWLTWLYGPFVLAF
ncbi:MAG: prepilin peptidase [Alphaproteobacteria bacterium]|nr:prepilin peptidase [Alphaproteobacteria bacterium]